MAAAAFEAAAPAMLGSASQGAGGALLSGIFGLGSSAITANATKYAADRMYQMQDQRFQYSKQIIDSYQTDFKNAGLNPLAVFGGIPNIYYHTGGNFGYVVPFHSNFDTRYARKFNVQTMRL